MGNSGFFGISGPAAGGGAFASQAGGIANQAVPVYNAAGTSAGAFSTTSAGAFNSSTNFYGQDAKTGMISYPTQF